MIVNLAREDWSEHRLGFRSLRSLRTPTVERGLRGEVYTTGLMQAEELWDAADDVSSLASPILRYYAMVQACRSLVAASHLGNSDWEARNGHGLALRVPSGNRWGLDDVLIRSDGEHQTAQKLAQALDSPLLTRQTPLTDLIGALPFQSFLDNSRDRPAMVVGIEIGLMARLDEPELIVNGLPSSMSNFTTVESGARQAIAPNRSELQEFLSRYPSLSKLPPPQRYYVDPSRRREGGHVLHLFWTKSQMPSFGEWHHFFDVWKWPYESGSDPTAYALPAIAGNDRVQHPLVTWFVVLYALSMLARYHANGWRRLLDYDANPESTLLERLVDHDSRWAVVMTQLAIEQFRRNACAAGS